ncbi:YdcH family protein [Shewanella sp.]|uniref:YdcH family protein n=1 Tax=Shewanella sp. TaxID=50422 RepID=UPI003A976717
MFSEYRALVDQLKADDSEFRKLFNEHELLDKEIHKEERRLASEFTADLKQMKKRKLDLKQQLFDKLKEHPAYKS